MKHVFPLVLSAVAMGVATGCRPSPGETARPIPAVQVSRKMAEADLAVVTLTAEAEKRLGIQTHTVVRRVIETTRNYGGEIMLPPFPAERAPPAVEGRAFFSFALPTTPSDFARAAQAQVDADGAVATATVQRDAAQLALSRAEELVAARSGVGRAVDDARTQVGLAEAALHTARERRALLGAAIVDAVGASRRWVRVSVYAGDLAQLKTGAPATVSVFGRQTTMTAPRWNATPVAVPFSASGNPLIADLFFEVNEKVGKLKPGLKVSVSLPIEGSESILVIPASAILHDAHGDTWVYERVGSEAFRRRRVEVRRIVDGDALLARGPDVGAKIVTAGAMELFGSEFGAGK